MARQGIFFFRNVRTRTRTVQTRSQSRVRAESFEYLHTHEISEENGHIFIVVEYLIRKSFAMPDATPVSNGT